MNIELDPSSTPDRDELDLDVSVAKSLFVGRITEENLFPYPRICADEAETLAMVSNSLDNFLQDNQEDFPRWDRESAQPEAFLKSLRELGLFGLIIPEDYGGIGLSNAGYTRVVEQLSSYDSSAALTVTAHSSIGMKGLLLFGTDEQKARYLPKLASGEMIAAFCLTESGSGSDAASVETKAEKNQDGSWTLNGEKIWITNGGIGDFYTVFARTGNDAGELSAFFVERSWRGVNTGAKEDKMGIRASSTTSVSFSDVTVPAENLLGRQGQGFKIAMSILNNGRTGLGGGSVGGMKACIALATAQALERKQFGQSIAEFGLIKTKIAQMAIDCFAAESVVWMVAHYIDSGCNDYSMEAAISKVFASEAMQRVANEALQIAGGNGYMKEFPYEQIVRDSRILTIFEGTSEILRLYIALSGMKEAGRLMEELAESVEDVFNNPIKGLGVLSEYAGRRIAQITPFRRDKMVSCVPATLRNEALIYDKYASELGRVADVLLRRHGKEIVSKQLAMKRLADIVIDLFVGLSVLARASSFTDDGETRYQQAINVAKLFTQQAKRRMNQNFRRIMRNEDDDLKQLAQFIFSERAYPWDVL
jgi:alkylation response protein AidB-like acyl-CoA dehydrogenase